MIELLIISTAVATISAIFAWAGYRYLLPNIKIDVFAEESRGTIKLEVCLSNAGGRNTLIDSNESFLIIENLGKNKPVSFRINFRNLQTGSFEDKISSNGGKLSSSFEFNYPIKITSITVKDKFSPIRWKLSKKKKAAANKSLDSTLPNHRTKRSI